MQKNKVLIIRLSSFGDIVQCSNILECFDREDELHWVTRKDFFELVSLNSRLSKVFFVDREDGIIGLIKLAIHLRSEKYSHVYDAHNNLRSKLILLFLLMRIKIPKILVRSKNRFKRLMLFTFKKNLFEWPFRGALSYLSPLEEWNIKYSTDKLSVNWQFKAETKKKVEELIPHSNFIVLIPSAAWEMKRWPLEYWKKLIFLAREYHFVVLGGKEDTFCEDLRRGHEDRVTNLAGKLSLIESTYLMKLSICFVSGDTGLLHVADSLNKKGLALIGPSAFGYTTSRNIKTIELNLDCKPCSKDGSGKCINQMYKKCLVDLTPELILKNLNEIANG